MKCRQTGALLCSALLLAGCAASRGGQDIDCERFDDYAETQQPTGFVADIQRFAPSRIGGSGVGAESRGTRALEDLLARDVFGRMPGAEREGGVGAESAGPVGAIEVERFREPRNMLLLSGGGQWGAYGAGLFLGMVCNEQLAPIDGQPSPEPALGSDPSSLKIAPADRNIIPCIDNDPEGISDEYTGEYRRIKAEHVDFKRLDDMDIGVITGVSTGGLQSLLLTIILDRTQMKLTRIAALQQLLNSYAPADEGKLVDRNSFLRVVFTGSVAGTDPLRGHVTDVLQMPFQIQTYTPTGQEGPIEERRLIDQIGASRITALAGIVEGSDGRFKYVNMKEMVQRARDYEALASFRGGAPNSAAPDISDGRPDKPTRCVLATTLASAAMPVFHQQLRVKRQRQSGVIQPVTLFDGGVRRSVFLGRLGELFRQNYIQRVESMTKSELAEARRQGSLPRIYVLRNGPTTTKLGEGIDEVSNAQPQALRAYSLLVNELEVGSIAALRLSHPFGPIDISTADGSQDHEPGVPVGDDGLPIDPLARRACIKESEEMFNPRFMRCLQNFGARRAMELATDAEARDEAKDRPSLAGFWPMRAISDPPRAMEDPLPD